MTTIITSQHVNSKVITINTNSGSDNASCCVDGECNCSSLSTALTNTTNNTVINITSESVTLEEHIVMGSGDNITIIGSGVTIMCNYSGRVELTCSKVCTRIVIEGITWDRCGGPAYELIALELNSVADVLIRNCVFRHLSTTAYIKMDHGSVIIDNCSFVLYSDSSHLFSGESAVEIYKSHLSPKFVNVTVFINNSNFYRDVGIQPRYAFYIDDQNLKTAWNITILKAEYTFDLSVHLALTGGYVTLSEVSVHDNEYSLLELTFTGYYNQKNVLSVLSSHFSGNNIGVLKVNSKGHITTLIRNSTFTENQLHYSPLVELVSSNSAYCSLTLIEVQISKNSIYGDTTLPLPMGIFSARFICNEAKVDMKRVNVTCNKYPYSEGGVMYLKNNNLPIEINISESVFTNNTSLRSSVFYLDQIPDPVYFILSISNSVFDRNFAQTSIIYIQNFLETHFNLAYGYFKQLNFTNNFGVCIFLKKLCKLEFNGDMLFVNNTAENGAVLYLDRTSTIIVNDGANVQFINNSAAIHGGAVFIDYNLDCNEKYYPAFSFSTNATAEVSFINNIAGYGPNAIYFSVFKYCNLIVNSSDTGSIMHVPYQFNYSQIINGTLTHVPTDYNYTWLNVTQFPVVTSPHQLKLYGDDIQLISNNTYFVGNKVLGKAVTFQGVVLDYFDRPAEVTQFHLDCINCSTNWSLVNTFLVIDNISPLNVILVGEEVVNKSVIVTLNLLSSISYSYNHIEVTLVVELIPCPDHPGYHFSNTSKGCICYHHDVVECYEDYNEIKRGHWFGSVHGQATTSLCPNQYCQFDHNRKKTRDGYYMIPKKVNGQCEHRRSGSACGECSPGYTLAYDSTDCISIDHCSTGITVLVVVLTCLYWIAIVAVTFLLVASMKFRISSGYVYGIIYYYSMVGILLSNNPYISDGALVFINILSGFAQLTPRFLGQLCLAQGLSGIDQLFIHYCHAVAISLFLIAFVFVVKCSRKISVLGLVSRNIIPVISLLLLLSYTSLTSTSLQLLRPLTFTDISEVYTYSSPDIKYFHGRHVLYGMVAVFCELVIGIGLPVILIMEPFLSRKFNLVRFKHFRDEFGSCYKVKYRWFAAYYLICRQLIVLIVLLGNNNYDKMLLYLQITCLVIAAIHIWIRPYKNTFLNLLDGLILQIMVAVVVMSDYDFLDSVPVIILVVFPILFLCTINVIKRVADRRRWNYLLINESDEYAVR